MNTATYKLLRVADGRCNFAKVQVGIVQDGYVPALDRDMSVVDNEWIDAARQGIDFTLQETKRSDQVALLSIVGTMVDTTESAVYCAAAIATFRLLGIDSKIEFFNGENWVVGEIDENRP